MMHHDEPVLNAVCCVHLVPQQEIKVGTCPEWVACSTFVKTCILCCLVMNHWLEILPLWACTYETNLVRFQDVKVHSRNRLLTAVVLYSTEKVHAALGSREGSRPSSH